MRLVKVLWLFGLVVSIYAILRSFLALYNGIYKLPLLTQNSDSPLYDPMRQYIFESQNALAISLFVNLSFSVICAFNFKKRLHK